MMCRECALILTSRIACQSVCLGAESSGGRVSARQNERRGCKRSSTRRRKILLNCHNVWTTTNEQILLRSTNTLPTHASYANSSQIRTQQASLRAGMHSYSSLPRCCFLSPSSSFSSALSFRKRILQRRSSGTGVPLVQVPCHTCEHVNVLPLSTGRTLLDSATRSPEHNLLSVRFRRLGQRAGTAAAYVLSRF